MEYKLPTMEDVYNSEKQALFTVISTFAGCGGSSTGYRLAGGKILAINEFIQAAIDTYKANYPSTTIFPQDIRKLKGEDFLNKVGLKVGELDILDGSPPCASFSLAGNREEDWGKIKTYSDTTQRTDDLFFEFARILKEIQPKVFVGENVKGLTIGEAKNLLGSEQLDMFDNQENTILHTLKNCGYIVGYRVLNASHYGVPQARNRCIFIGVRKDLGICPSFPNPTTLYHPISVLEALEGVINSKEDIENASYNPSSKILNEYVIRLKEGESGDKYNENGSYFGLQRIERNKPCPTICQRQGNKGACLVHYQENRELTIPELKRLQSLPDDFKLVGNYKQNCERIGRSVAPLMMKAIAEHIYENVLRPLKEINNAKI